MAMVRDAMCGAGGGGRWCDGDCDDDNGDDGMVPDDLMGMPGD